MRRPKILDYLRSSGGSIWRRSRKEWRGTWRWGHNLVPTLRHFGAAPLSEPASVALDCLTKSGFASDTLTTLTGDPHLFTALRETVDLVERAQAKEIWAARAALNGDVDPDREKVFLYQPLGDPVTLDLTSPYAALANALSPIADAYFGMCTQVRAYAIWHNLASPLPPTDSQLWHRDREDLQILKAFVYLDDVTSGNGPFWYAPGTHHLGPVQQSARSERIRGVHRTTDEDMAEVVPSDAWIEATGTAGTVVLADTHGYHKGGHAMTGDRRLVMVLFTSQESGAREWFDRTSTKPPTDPVERFRWSRC